MDSPTPPFKIEGSLFKFIASLFKRHEVRGVLVGGYALIANKVQRMTFDVDFMVTSVDCKKIEAEILNAGYSIFSNQDAFVQYKNMVSGLRDIDFLIGDRHTIDTIIADGKEVVIAGETFSVPSPMHLQRLETEMADSLKLPVITKEPLPPLLRSIDEIDRWIEENYALFFDREIYEKEKRLNSVNVPFVLN